MKTYGQKYSFPVSLCYLYIATEYTGVTCPCICFKSKGSKPLFCTKLIRHQQKMHLKYCQKSGLNVTVLLKNGGERVNKEPFLQDSSVCTHQKNSVYEFGYGKLCELNLNYSWGCNFQIFFVIDMWWWLIIDIPPFTWHCYTLKGPEDISNNENFNLLWNWIYMYWNYF